VENEIILKKLALQAALLELHGENEFKSKAYHTAIFHLEKISEPLVNLSIEQLSKLQGVGKAIAEKIYSLAQVGSFKQLDELLAQTPASLVELLNIKGLGTKKLRVLWQELGIENADQLLQACENDQIQALKGFGPKVQENIKMALLFTKSNQGKWHYAEAEASAKAITAWLHEQLPPHTQLQVVGQIRRKVEVVDEIQFVLASPALDKVVQVLERSPLWDKNQQNTGLFTWRGTLKPNPMAIAFHLITPAQWANEVFLWSAAEAHLRQPLPNQSGHLLALLRQQAFADEASIYQTAGLDWIEPEMREGYGEIEKAAEHRLPSLIELSDIQGIIHAHSTYSDGKHTLAAMAEACQQQGYKYLGITDHSKAAFYANGLDERRVLEQHAEIEQLNQQLAPFRIFKGIEADILADGSLDYGTDFLKHFDFVIASVHSVLSMSEEKATQRLIKAIENPYTTILGHPTGRLLLRREGYPIQHTKILDACAANQVAVEINASPWRLDLDWRWIDYALQKGVTICINPDAHAIAGIQDVYYGVCVARKGGLTSAATLNTKSVEEVASFFAQKKNL